jgi:hypothetical protein
VAETASDDLPTTLAIGVTASVAQFVVHEVLGHGSACLLVGGRVLAVAPLWMRCSVDHRLMVLAGPMANVVVGAVCWAVLRASPLRTAGVRLFVWLSIAFQWLVAAGYLAVGAASGFGDWPVILPALSSWPVRVVAIAVAAGGYLLSLRALARVGMQRLGSSLAEESRLGRLGFLPSLAAAAVSVLAELVGGRFQPLGLGLAIGCTAVVGWSLLAVPRFVSPNVSDRRDRPLFVQRSRAWILGGAAAAVAFIVLVGPAHGS